VARFSEFATDLLEELVGPGFDRSFPTLVR
jgi:hypothetical protein